MKNTRIKVNFHDKSMANRVWLSVVARYLITDMENIVEDVSYINTLIIRSVSSEHFGFHLSEYIKNRIEYCETLKGEDQIKELAQTYIIFLIFKNTSTGKHCEYLEKMKKSIEEEGIIRIDFMYLRQAVNFVYLFDADNNLLPYYLGTDYDSEGCTIAVAKSMKTIICQMSDIISQCNKEIENIKSLSCTDDEIGMAFKSYLKNRKEYIKLLDPTMGLYHILWIETLTREIKEQHFGHYKKEVEVQRKKMHMLKESLQEKISIK